MFPFDVNVLDAFLGVSVELPLVTVITIQPHFPRLYDLFAQVQVALANFSSMLLLQEKL